MKKHDRPLRCQADPTCTTTKAEQRDLDRHYCVTHKAYAERIGLSLEPIPCEYCNTTFGRLDNLIKHMKNKHKINLAQTDIWCAFLVTVMFFLYFEFVLMWICVSKLYTLLQTLRPGYVGLMDTLVDQTVSQSTGDGGNHRILEGDTHFKIKLYSLSSRIVQYICWNLILFSQFLRA